MKWPPREGPLGGGPVPNLQQGPQSKARHAFPQQCAHTETREERLPANHVHYARLSCANCGAFIGWAAKPANVERRTLNAYRLARLGMVEQLNPWERRFVQSVSQCRKVSPKQQQIIERLVEQYLEAKT
jgi:hypothetical protein